MSEKPGRPRSDAPKERWMATAGEVAHLLRISAAQFSLKRNQLYADGFPKPHHILGRYNLEAVRRYIDRGITPDTGSSKGKKAQAGDDGDGDVPPWRAALHRQAGLLK